MSVSLLLNQCNMVTVTLEIDEKKPVGKTFLELIEFFHSKKDAVTVVDEESPYDPAFVEKVLKAAATQKRYRIDPKNLWESIS